jgi:hypothetical protein
MLLLLLLLCRPFRAGAERLFGRPRIFIVPQVLGLLAVTYLRTVHTVRRAAALTPHAAVCSHGPRVSWRTKPLKVLCCRIVDAVMPQLSALSVNAGAAAKRALPPLDCDAHSNGANARDAARVPQIDLNPAPAQAASSPCTNVCRAVPCMVLKTLCLSGPAGAFAFSAGLLLDAPPHKSNQRGRAGAAAAATAGGVIAEQ